MIRNKEGIEKLWKFIRKTSRGKRFNCQTKIEEQQLVNAYSSFLQRSNSDKYIIDLAEAISSDVHDWDDTIRVEVPWTVTSFTKPEFLIKSKKKLADSVIQVVPLWRDSSSSLEEDYNFEIRSQAQALFDNFLKLACYGNIEQQLSSQNFVQVSTLFHIVDRTEEWSEKINNIKNFLNSNYFSNIPHINISTGLWTMLKQEIKKKQFPQNEEKIKEQVKGIQFDIEHLSVFAPYCDAVFTEKRMARWLREWGQHSLGGYEFKVFSLDNINEFEFYLEEMERNITAEMQEELAMVYGF